MSNRKVVRQGDGWEGEEGGCVDSGFGTTDVVCKSCLHSCRLGQDGSASKYPVTSSSTDTEGAHASHGGTPGLSAKRSICMTGSVCSVCGAEIEAANVLGEVLSDHATIRSPDACTIDRNGSLLRDHIAFASFCRARQLGSETWSTIDQGGNFRLGGQLTTTRDAPPGKFAQ